jgi:hypothetical protein
MTALPGSPSANADKRYFAYPGACVAVILAATALGTRIGRPWYGMITWDLLALLVVTAAFAFSIVARKVAPPKRIGGPSRPRLTFGLTLGLTLGLFNTFLSLRARVDWPSISRKLASVSPKFAIALAIALSALYAVCSLAVASTTHRRFVIVIGVLTAFAIYSLRRLRSGRKLAALIVLCVTSWCLASGLTFTGLGDWLFDAQTEELAVPAFLASAALILAELCDDRLSAAKTRLFEGLAIALVLIVFAGFAFRSDHLLDSWVPYHRSFIADVAQAVRGGYWPLWDVPSLYGFLSVLTVAAIPAANAWQGLFILNSFILFAQSCILFTLWRCGCSGWRNLAFASFTTLAVFWDGISRYPWSARLYAQGGMRFLWVLSLLFVAFLSYVWRDEPRRVRLLLWIGNCCWLISLFWSFETGVWGMVVWGLYIFTSAAIPNPKMPFLKRLSLLAWPLVALPLGAFAVLEIVYKIVLHNGPDLFAYVEFTGLFVTGVVSAAFPINAGGAGWCILLMLGAVGALLLAAIGSSRWPAVPLLSVTWIAIWSGSAYYSVEPFDGHVSLLLVLLSAGAAIVTYVSREVLKGTDVALFSRLSFAPIAIICMSFFLGEPSRLAAIQFPFTPGWTSNTLDSLPPIHGELAQLIARSGIAPHDSVLFPSRPYWTEISQGLLFPISRKSGKTILYRAWAPLSPVGIEETILGLSDERRREYIERHLQRTHAAGWYIEYRYPAACDKVSSRLYTARTLTSKNYSLSLCEFRRGL